MWKYVGVHKVHKVSGGSWWLYSALYLLVVTVKDNHITRRGNITYNVVFGTAIVKYTFQINEYILKP